MSEAKFKLTSVCGCGWASDQPKAACGNCGQAICPQCGSHCVTVAAWPGEGYAVLLKRAHGHIVDVLREARVRFVEDERDGARH